METRVSKIMVKDIKSMSFIKSLIKMYNKIIWRYLTRVKKLL